MPGYSRAFLLQAGRMMLTSNVTHRISPDTYILLKQLGICTAIPTKRGKRSGKSKCHAVMNERGAVQKIKSIVTNRSNQQSNISCGVKPPNLTCLSPVNRKTTGDVI